MLGIFLAALPLAPLPSLAALPAIQPAAFPACQPAGRPSPLWDEADDAYAFIAGLADKGLHDVVVREATRFLERYSGHSRANDVRYALAGARFELGQLDQARPLYERLVGANGFGFPDEVRFRLGQCYLDDKQLDAAVKAFESVSPGYLRVPSLYLAGEAFFQGERYAEAAERFAAVRATEREAAPQGQAQAEESYGADALHGLAWCALRLEQPDAAVESAEQFLTQYPGDPRLAELRFLAGEAHRAAGRTADALAFYRAVERDSADGDTDVDRWREASLRGAAFAAAAGGDTQDAAARFGLLLERYPTGRYADEAALQRGVNLVLAGQAGRAREALADGRVADGPTTEYWRGRAALADGDPAAAEQHLSTGLAGGPPEDLRSELASSRGDALFELGRTAEAAASYEQSGSAYALHAGAVAHLNDGRAEESERLARRLLKELEGGADGAEEFSVEGQLVLAEALFARQQYAAAEPSFLAVVEAPGNDSRSARALSRSGWCRYLSEDWSLAADRFRLLSERYPQSKEAAEACFLAGRCAEEQGAVEQAVERYDRYAQEFREGPLRPESLLRAARLLPGEPGEERLVRLLQDHGQSELAADAAVELGDRRVEGGRMEPAAQAYRFTIAQAPESTAVHAARYGLGWALYESGDSEGALAALADLVQGEGAPEDLVQAGQELRVFAAKAAANPGVAMEAFAAFAPRCEDESRRVAAAEVVGECLVQAGALPDARTLYAAVARGLGEPTAVGRMAVARAYLDLDAGAPDEAEAQVRLALQTRSDDPAALEAAFFLGEARFAAEADEQAALAYDVAAASLDPEVQSRAFYKAGFARLRKANALAASEDPEVAAGAPALWESAGKNFDALVEGHAGTELYGEGLFLGGECAYRRGDLERSRALMGRLLKDRPRHATRPKALFRLGLAQAKQGAFLEASRSLASLRKETPQFEGILEAELWRGKSLLQLADMRGAKQALERVCSEDRGVLSAQAYLALGELAQLEEDLDEALSQFLKVAVLYALDDEVSEALYRAGQVLEAKDDPERARAQYADASQRFPKTPFGQKAAERLSQLSR